MKDLNTYPQQMIENNAETFIQFEAVKWFPFEVLPSAVIEQLRDYSEQLAELADNMEVELPIEAE